jgi:uncharacterized delta-60 repeat protein
MGIGSFINPIISGGEGNFDIDTDILFRFTRLTDTGDFDFNLVNQVFVDGVVSNIDGSLVSMKNGFIGEPFAFGNISVFVITIDSNGKIYVGGFFAIYNGIDAGRIIRLNPDGSRDTDFDMGSGFNFSVNDIKIDADGKIYVGGVFSSYNGVGANRIIRLNPDGSRDTDFDMGSGFNQPVIDITIDANGKIYVGGGFTSYNGVAANRIIRLNPDGSRDTDFDIGTGFNGGVEDIKIDADGKIYVCGDFVSYNGL